MKHWKTAILLALCALLPLCALAEPLTPDGEYTGAFTYPEGTSEDEAAYVYTYVYPRLPEGDEVCDTINGFYTYAVEDAAAFAVPMGGEEAVAFGQKRRTDITYDITCNNDRYFSVRVTAHHTFSDEEEREVLTAQTFAREGGKAGNVVALPYLLGILADDESDTWLQDRQTAKADDCIRRMILEQLEDRGEEGLFTEEELETMFYPEEDFYLDENGDPVFFVQLYGEIHLFPIPLEDVLDEI